MLLEFLRSNVELFYREHPRLLVEQGEKYVALSDMVVVLILLTAVVVSGIIVFPLKELNTYAPFLVHIVQTAYQVAKHHTVAVEFL